MPEMKAAVPVLPISDPARSVAFYADRLGFTVHHRDQGYVALGRDAIQIHLWVAGDESWKSREAGTPIESGAESFLAGTASCRVQVDGIESLYAEATALGIVHPNGPLAAKPWGFTEFSILDPDNNLVTFYQRMGG